MSELVKRGAAMLRDIVVGNNSGASDNTAASADDTKVAEVFDIHDVLLRVMFYISIDDRLRNAVLVNSSWRDAALDASFWRELVDEQVFKIAGHNATGRQLGLAHLRWALYCRNLLANPTFLENGNLVDPFARTETRKKAWVVREAGGNGVLWELSPGGVRCEDNNSELPPAPLPFPRKPSEQSKSMLQRLGLRSPARLQQAPRPAVGTLATSYEWAELVQVVDLVEELARRGIAREAAEQLLDSGLALGLTLWVGARWDCSSQFAVGLMLEDAHTEVTNFQHFVRRPSSHHFYSGKLATEQGHWKCFKYAVDALPLGCRRAIVLLRGKDRQFWAGHYGAKFASAELRFLRREELPAFGAEESQEFWAQRKIAQTVQGLFGEPEQGALVVWGAHGMPGADQEGEGSEEEEGEEVVEEMEEQ